MSVRDTNSAISRLREGFGPQLSGAAERPVVAGNERRHNRTDGREARIALGFAFALLVVVVALPLAFEAHGPSAAVVLELVAAVALLSRVEFDVVAGYTQTLEAAVAQLERRAGTQFDPAVVEAAVAVVERPAAATNGEFLELASPARSDGARETTGAGTPVSQQVEQPL